MDCQALAGQTHHALDKVGAPVDGAVFHLAEFLRVGVDLAPAEYLDQQVVVHRVLLVLGGDGVAGGEVEHHDVVALDVAQAGQTAVFHLGPRGVAVAADKGHGVVRQGEVDGCDGHARAVDHLVYPQIVAGEQCLFKRRRGYLVVLADEGEHKVHQYQRVDDGVDPRHHRARDGRLRLLPPGEGDVARDVDVEEQRQAQQEPVIVHPHHP